MSTTPAKAYKVLTDADVKQFLERGWIKVEGAIPQDNIDLYLNNGTLHPCVLGWL